MKQEILVKLRSAEDDTSRRVEQAKERAADLLKESRVRADEVRRQAADDVRRDQEQQMRQERERLEAEREKILAEGQAREEQLRNRYAAQVEAQVKKALQVLQRSMDA